MEALAGPVLVVSALLALAGALKVLRPEPTVGALRTMRLPSAPLLVRAVGLAEIAVGGAAGVTFARPFLALLAAFYLAFAGFVTLALMSGAPLQSCGCLGQTDTPPSTIHVGVNVAAAAAALAAAITETPALRDTVSDQPWHAAPFVVLVGVCVYLCVLVITVLPSTFGSSPNA